jgi:hypothetical protein
MDGRREAICHQRPRASVLQHWVISTNIMLLAAHELTSVCPTSSPRSCIGKTFATAEIKVLLVCDIQRRKMLIHDILPGIDCHPTPTIFVAVRERHRIIPKLCDPSSGDWRDCKFSPAACQQIIVQSSGACEGRRYPRDQMNHIFPQQQRDQSLS